MGNCHYFKSLGHRVLFEAQQNSVSTLKCREYLNAENSALQSKLNKIQNHSPFINGNWQDFERRIKNEYKKELFDNLYPVLK